MRYPLDKNRNEVLSEQDIVSSNVALNTVFGGTRKSWMGGAGTGVRPTERSKTSTRIIAPQNSRTSTGTLPPPARSDQPNPIIRDSHLQPQQDPQTREQASHQINIPGQPVQIIASPPQVTPVQDGTVPLPQNNSNQSVQNTPLLSPSPPSTEPSQPPLSSLNGQPVVPAGSSLARNSQTSSATSLPGSSTAAESRQSQTRDYRLSSSQTPQRPLPPHVNVPHQTLVATQTAQSPMAAMSSNAGSAPFWDGRANLQRQLLATEVHSNLPSAEQQEVPVPQTRQQQVPLPSTLIHLQQPRGTDGRPAKRQRIKAPMPSLKLKVNMIDQQIRSLARTPNSSLEYARYSLLREACGKEDSFYVAFHQLFCLWDLEHEQVRSQITDLPGFPSTDVLRGSFGILSMLIRENKALLAEHMTWFTTFPSPLNLLKTSEPYMRAVDNVGKFLGKLQTQWISLNKEVTQRKYPPLVDEMIIRMGLLSPVLQQVVFTASRRNLGFGDDSLGHYVESLFMRDRDEHRKLSARINTAQPPTDKEIEARNLTLQNEYVTAYSTLCSPPPVVDSAGSPVLQSTPGYLPSNGYPVRQDNNHFPNPNFSVQQPGQYPQQQLRMVSNPSPVLSPLASHGRPGSIGGHQSYHSTPSPTLLQGLSMHSPVQQGFPSALRNDNVQASNGLMNQLPNQQMQQYTTPQLQQFITHQQAVITQQQQQLQLQQQQQQSLQAQPQQQQYYRPPPTPRMSQAQNAPNAHIQRQQAVQQQQAILRQQQQQQDISRQQNHQDMLQQQHVINFNRTAEIRRDSAPMINAQNHIRSRNSSISTNGRQTPVRNMSAGQSPHMGANLEYQTRNALGMGPASPIIAMQSRIPQQGMPRIKGIENRLLFPPLGMRPHQTATAPDQTALHQSRLRSPLLRVASVSHLENPQNDSNCRHYQVVTRLAFGPSKLTHDVPLTKFSFEISSEDLKRIPKDHVYGTGKVPMRELKSGSLQYRLRCIQANPDVTACLPADWVVSDTNWPEGIFLAINTQELEIRRKFHHSKDMPIDITQGVIDNQNKSQEVTVSIPEWGPKTYTYLFAVEVIEILQHKQIMEMCQQQRKSASQTLDTIKRILAPQDDEDDDFAMVSSDLVIGLADPFMAQIFKIPVRGNTCKHHECFDLETFLLTRVSKPKRPQQPCMPDVWKCPLCGRDARPGSLIVDDFLLSVREELARQDKLDVKAIIVSPDGSWKAKHEPAPKRRATKDPYDDDSTDDEADGNDTGTPAPLPKKKVIEIIDLDDD